MLAALILALVLFLIAVRQVGRFSMPIPAAMALGAAGVLAVGAISPQAAFASIQLDVMAFLFAMFALSAGLERSGAAEELIHRLTSNARNPQELLIILSLLFAVGAALVVNDTMAVVGAPMLIFLAGKLKVEPKPLILIACFAITIGSMVSPIGNPQNLLVALSGGVNRPFVDFAIYLLVPAIASIAALVLLAPVFWPEIKKMRLGTDGHLSMVRDKRLARDGTICVVLFLFLVMLHIALPDMKIELWMAALAPAILLLIVSPRRIELARSVDWMTLLFFAAMFVLMQAVWNEGTMQALIAPIGTEQMTNPLTVSALAVLISQIISNVPMVMLYLPILKAHLAAPVAYLALAGASTLAGNLTIMGAASNVILLEAARKRGVEVGWGEFLKYGIVMTLIPLALMLAWMKLIGAW